MTSVEIPETTPQVEVPAEPRRWMEQLDAMLEWAGEFLNPILVKETRQALKSKQFVITFTLVLLAGWVWSVLAIILRSPGIAYSPDGPLLLVGYFDIMLFPLIIIIPFTAFRSLASEREDGTYELLSISTLTPGHIIRGKLGSSVIQMLVYFSALAPCVAFTYLLRGIDVLSIGLCLLFAFLVSLLLAVSGLLLATVANAKHWQAVVSVVIILGLALVYFFSLQTTYWMILEDVSWRAFDNPDFWMAVLASFTIYLSFFFLIYYAAVAQITFSSENRVWKLRTVMLAQHFLFLGWWGYVWLNIEFPGPLGAAAVTCCIYWGIMGALMIGENPALSPRVRRSIPHSLLGRVRLNWRLPGPARGYFLATTAVASGGALVAISSLVPHAAHHYGSLEEITWVAILLPCYVICYLGLGRLIMAGIQRFARGGIFISLLIHSVLLAGFCGVPWSFQLWYTSFREQDYTLLQIANPFWTVVRLTSQGSIYDVAEFEAIVIILLTASGLMYLLQLYFSGHELVPSRVEESKQASIDATGKENPASDTPISPWD